MTFQPISRPDLHRDSISPVDAGRRAFASPFLTAGRILLLAALFGAPWAIGAVQPWAWGAIMVLALVALMLWGAGCVHCGVLRVSWSPLNWPFLGIMVIAGIQLISGLTADYVATREALLKLITNFVLFFLADQLLFRRRENGRSVKLWALLATVLSLALSALAVAQLMTTGHGMIYWSIPTHFGPLGPYVSPNDYCGIMEMLIPVSAGYILSGASPRIPRLLLWSTVGLGLATIAISGSRGGAAVIFIELLLFGFVLFRNRPHRGWQRPSPFMLGLILASAAIFVWMANPGRIGNRILSVFQADKSFQMKVGDRLWVAKDTLRMARHHPALGIGVGSFETVFPGYMTRPSDLHWTHAHDDFAEGLAETGMLGGVLMLWALVLFFRRAFSHFSESMQTEWGWIHIGAIVGVVGLLCHSLVDFNLRVPANAAWFVVCVAVATHPITSSQRSPRVIREAFTEPHERFLT